MQPDGFVAVLEERTEPWILEEFGVIRREAQEEADVAYREWCLLQDRDRYTIYRAAQDRADAAQDDLAAAYEAAGVTTR